MPLGDFRYTEAWTAPWHRRRLASDVDDSDWDAALATQPLGRISSDFAMRNEFSVPADWDADLPVALYLPIGEAGDFSHPEALVYVDGERYGHDRPPSPGGHAAGRLARRHRCAS